MLVKSLAIINDVPKLIKAGTVFHNKNCINSEKWFLRDIIKTNNNTTKNTNF